MQRRVPRLHLVAGVRALVGVGPVPDQRAGDAGREVCRELGADCRGSVGQRARVLHPDADLADKQRLAQRAALVEPELQLRSEGARRAAVIVNLTEIDSRDTVHVLVGGPGKPAIVQTPAPQAQEMVGIDALDQPGHVLGKMLQRPRGARTAAAGWIREVGFVDQLPRQDRRVVAVPSHDFSHPGAISIGHAGVVEAGIAGAVPGFVPAGGTQAFAIAEVVAQRRDHTLVVRPRHRQRGVEGAPVAPPVARGERLEEPGPKDVLSGPDGGKGLIE